MAESSSNNSGLVDTLREVGKIVRDSEEGYRHAANDIDDWQLRSMFLELARVRSEQGDEIDRLLQRFGGEAVPKGGSTSGTMVDRVQTKTVHPAVKPERRCLEQRRQNLFVS